ncbi:MAG: M14 family metallopeptidase [Phycisphaerales bacterium]
MKLGSCRTWRWPVLFVAFLIAAGPAAAADYYNPAAIAERLAWLAASEPNLVHIRELAVSQEKRKVWMVEVGAGSEQDRAVRPALLVVAGIERNDLVGPVTVLSWIERLAKEYRKSSASVDLLNATTIYAVPCLNPDATEQYFTEPRIERNVNGTPNDEDHDGLRDEDGCEDLNGDGLITLMRVEDKEGQYIADPNEPRLLLKADPLKGERPVWRLLPEGIDNDGDKRWNEDGPGGVNFNRNFPFAYVYFAPDAGVHPVSEDETRALADFVVAHPNIGIVLTYGAADNLRKTPKSGPPAGRSKPLETIRETDIGYYETFGKIYRAKLGLDQELEGVSEPGTFSDWMYFHRGRLSLAARPWDAAAAVAALKSQKDEKEKSRKPGDANTPDAGKKPDKDEDRRGADEREQLQWFDEHAPDAFLAWQAIEHPDFPGRRVEVGGWRPFAQTNPPLAILDELAEKQGDFLTELVGRLPRLQIAKVACRLLADSIYEIEILVTNVGFLPTALAHGETSQQVLPTRLTLELEPQCFLAGKRTTPLPTISGSGGTAKARYTVRVTGIEHIRFEVTSALAGRIQGTIELLKAGEQ